MSTNKRLVEDAGVYMDPLSDWGWKTLFGSERYKEHLISFINAVYPELGVSEISYRNTEDQGDTILSRLARFDLICKTSGGETVLVEVQKAKQKHFFERLLWTSSFAVRDQAPAGRWDYGLKGIYSIGIISFNPSGIEGYSWDDGAYIHSFSLREDRDYRQMTSLLRYTFIAVDNFKKSVSELDNILEKWVYLLGNLRRLYSRPSELQDRVFERFFKAAEIARLPGDQQKHYRKSLMNENDWNNALEYARELAIKEGLEEGRAEGLEEGRAKGLAEGREEGRAEGRAKGLAEGREEERRDNAKKFLALGVSVDIISKATGLSEEQVLALAD